MKRIVLATRWKRVIARLIDFFILAILSFSVYFIAIYPNVFDKDEYVENIDTMAEIYDESGLYVKTNNYYEQISSFSTIDTMDELITANVKVGTDTYKTVNLTDSLYTFYTNKYSKYSNNQNLSNTVFMNDIMKVNTTDSNIKELVISDGGYEYILLDSTKASTTVQYVLDTFSSACDIVTNSTQITILNDANRNIMVNALIWFIPVLLGFSFVLDLVIPLCSRNGESIGKYIFHLAVLSKDGYTLKKAYLIPRWLAYILIEVILGVMTFGGVIIISYTMMIFNKKHRVIHDYLGNSVVINKRESLWFDSAKEENYIKSKQGGIV